MLLGEPNAPRLTGLLGRDHFATIFKAFDNGAAPSIFAAEPCGQLGRREARHDP